MKWHDGRVWYVLLCQISLHDFYAYRPRACVRNVKNRGGGWSLIGWIPANKGRRSSLGSHYDFWPKRVDIQSQPMSMLVTCLQNLILDYNRFGQKQSSGVPVFGQCPNINVIGI